MWENGLNGGVLLTSKALAGYMKTASGKRLAFAAFVNLVPLEKDGKPTREGTALARLCEVIYETN
jgi:D-alanyl-D-alanine carboxypeptidase